MECQNKTCNNEFESYGLKKFCSRKCKEAQKNRSKDKRKYVKYKKDKCENCGFIPIHSCQLDVDHIDGNHKNNSLDNLQTLCANCHRLKTFINKDFIKTK